MKNRPVFVACVTVFTATLALMPAAAQRPQPTDALGLRIDRPKMLRKGNQAIPQHYIVVLDMDAAGRDGNLSAARTVTDDLAFRAGAEVTHVYAHAHQWLLGAHVRHSGGGAQRRSAGERLSRKTR